MEQARGGGGTLGVLKGVGQGSVGLFTKPGSGKSTDSFDLSSSELLTNIVNETHT
jgi:hypothetical protein